MTRLTLIIAALAAIVSPRASHPDFTGTWVLDASKSFASGQMPGPSSSTYIVVQHGDSLNVDETISSQMGDLASKKVWVVDGKPYKNTMSIQGNDLPQSSVLSWNDQVLNIKTDMDFQGNPVSQADSWTLGPDGKTLTIKTTTSFNGQEFGTTTSVFNKK